MYGASVVSHCEASEVLELAEASLDAVAGAIGLNIVGDEDLSRPVGGDDSLSADVGDDLAQALES